MYTLRTFSKTNENLESNLFIGKNYEVVDRHCNPNSFNKLYKEVFGKNHEADLSDATTHYAESCQGFIVDESGMPIYLNKTDKYYIVSSDGKTFANLTYRSNKG